jgi:hypothetical protein
MFPLFARTAQSFRSNRPQKREESQFLSDLTVESLEDRRLLAGNVTVEVDDGDLEVRGENNTAHVIGIEATDVEGQFTITGIDTDINGSASPLVVNGVTGDFDIDMRSGGSLVILSESGEDELLIRGDLEIETRGNDADIILLDTVHVRGETKIETRGGDDSVNLLGGQYEDDFDLNTGGGNDVVSSVNSISLRAEVDIRMGGGNDYAMLATMTANNDTTDIRLGGGEDTIGIYDSEFLEAKINGNGRFDVRESFGSTYGELQERSIDGDFNDGFSVMLASARAEVSTFNDAIATIAFFGLGS